MNEDPEGAQLIQDIARPQVSKLISTFWQLVRIPLTSMELQS